MEDVENIMQFKTDYRAIVDNLIQCRKQSETTQESMAAWLNISRSTLTDFENCKRVDINLLLIYADRMSVKVKLNFDVI
jgi:DNA-binding XRE family transcriptional regulator